MCAGGRPIARSSRKRAAGRSSPSIYRRHAPGGPCADDPHEQQGPPRDPRAGAALDRRAEDRDGLLTLYCRHTSASLLIQENADPDVQRDLARFFEEIAPEATGRYRHDTEGPDDMP